MDTFDVAVIGAGVQGCAVAARLTERGARTLVLDRGSVASGPTGRSSAMCRAYYGNPFLAKVAHQSLAVLGEFETWSGGGHSGFKRTGMLYLHGVEDGPGLAASAAALNQLGTAVEILDVEQLAKEHPQFDTDGLGFAVWEYGAGPADPVGTTTGLLKLAKRRGATTSLYNAVERITLLDNGTVQLSTEKGTIGALRVLIAAGPWSKPLAQQVDVDIPLTVERHFVTTNTWGDATPLSYAVADVPGGYYLVPDSPTIFDLGQLLPEPTVDPNHYTETVTSEEQERMATGAVRRMPSLATAGAVGGWASLYDVSPDWQPVIGEIRPGVFISAGSSGHGFKLAPALGCYVADLMLDGVGEPGLEAFTPDRFSNGQLIGGGYGEARILG